MGYIYVVTSPDLGWDCVVDVCSNKEYAEQAYADQDRYVIHDCLINDATPATLRKSLERYGRMNTEYEIIGSDRFFMQENPVQWNMCLLMDNLQFWVGDYEGVNNRDLVSLICDNFHRYCKQLDVNYGTCYLVAEDNNDGTYAAVCDGFPDDYQAIVKDTMRLEDLIDGFEDYLKAKGITHC